MKYLILGSAGQIGGHLTKYLRGLGHEVVECDIVSNPECDLRVEGGFNWKYDFIFFLAFDVGGSRYLNKYQSCPEFHDNNMRIMTHVFDALNSYKSQFIFASSQMAGMPNSPYGALKQVGEHYTKALGGMVARFWNVYGIERDQSKAHVITDFIRMARENRRIDMLTDGSEKRQFLYADDCCEALHGMSEMYSLTNDRSFDVTSFEWTSVYEVAEIVLDEIELETNDAVSINRGSASDVVQQDARIEPDRAILKCWQPKTSLAEGIRKIIEATK